VIVALDQEEAYDRTLHQYLWAALQRQGIPERFTNTVKALYHYADTQVIINAK
jgi:hypothetical protein